MQQTQRAYVGAETENHFLYKKLPFRIPPQTDKELPAIKLDCSLCDGGALLVFRPTSGWLQEFTSRFPVEYSEEGLDGFCKTPQLLEQLLRQRKELRPMLDHVVWKRLIPQQSPSSKQLAVTLPNGEVTTLLEIYLNEQKDLVLMNIMWF